MKLADLELAIAIKIYNQKVRETERVRGSGDLARYREYVADTEIALAEVHRLQALCTVYPSMVMESPSVVIKYPTKT